MDATQKDMASRQDEIQQELQLLFEANMKISAWNVPEVDDLEAATLLLEILQQQLDTIHTDVKSGKYLSN